MAERNLRDAGSFEAKEFVQVRPAEVEILECRGVANGGGLTVDGTASAHYTLAVMTVVALIVTPVVLLYQGWTYHVFRHRVGDEPATGEGG